jgi:hypothetical protein
MPCNARMTGLAERCASSMNDSLSDIRSMLQDTSLALSPVAELRVRETHEAVFAIDVNAVDSLEAWKILRGLSEKTGRWPVLSMLHSDRSQRWDAQVLGADLFSRFYFKEERRDERRGDGPFEIVEAAQGIDVESQFSAFPPDEGYDLEEMVESELEGTRQEFGKAPSLDEALAFLSRESSFSPHSLERWLFDWEIKNCDDPLRLPAHGLAHMQWFEPKHESQALLLMPSLRFWEVPAYINWFASYRCNSQFIVALLKEWHSKYGAELVAHHGTMLHLAVSRRPTTPDEALRLAWQHYVMAPCTTLLPGVSLRNHARALLHTDRWFLHERP